MFDHRMIELRAWLEQVQTSKIDFVCMLSCITQAEAEEYLAKIKESLGEVARLVPLVQWKEQ